MDFSREFIAFACEQGVLRFGEFTTKAGRVSPYFFNAGLFNDGASLGRLCDFYALAIQTSGIEYDVLFGPAYKGIPLAAGTAIALARMGLNLAAGATPAGVLIALDRQERGNGDLSAVQEVEKSYGIPVISVARLVDLIAYLDGNPQLEIKLDAVRAYRAQYGIS